MRPNGLVVIGASWGGLDALRVLLAALSAAAPDRVLALAEIAPYLVERLRRTPSPGAPARCSSG